MIKSNHESRYDFSNRSVLALPKGYDKGKMLNYEIHQKVKYLMMFMEVEYAVSGQKEITKFF